MTPEKRKLSIDEQIKLMEQTGAYTHSLEKQSPPVGATPIHEQHPEPVDPTGGTGPVQPTSVHPQNFVPYANTFSGRGNIHEPLGTVHAPSGAGCNLAFTGSSERFKPCGKWDSASVAGATTVSIASRHHSPECVRVVSGCSIREP